MSFEVLAPVDLDRNVQGLQDQQYFRYRQHISTEKQFANETRDQCNINKRLRKQKISFLKRWNAILKDKRGFVQVPHSCLDNITRPWPPALTSQP